MKTLTNEIEQNRLKEIVKSRLTNDLNKSLPFFSGKTGNSNFTKLFLFLALKYISSFITIS